MAILLKRNVIKSIGDGVVEMQLDYNCCTIVDLSDCELLSEFRWELLRKDKGRKYVRSAKCVRLSSSVQMHRFILGVSDAGVFVDHINRNTLDNRRSNLRVCSATENARNRCGFSGRTSSYKGVCLVSSSGRWRAEIKVHGKKISIGNFKTETDAAIAYDKAALEYHGAFAYQNFPPVNLHASHNHEDCTMERNAMCGHR